MFNFKTDLRSRSAFFISTVFFYLLVASTQAWSQVRVEDLAAGIKKCSIGTPDPFTPYHFCAEKPLYEALANMPAATLPFDLQRISLRVTDRGAVVEIPLGGDEQIYGFGMQINSFNERGLRKRPIVNDNPLNDLGYTHAPATFYVTTHGYGILINTSRYTTFYCGTTQKLNPSSNGSGNTTAKANAQSVEELYKKDDPGAGMVTVDIPGAKGIEVFIFEGPDMKSAVQRYNLFSGGGCLPAIWGLGIKYRVKADFKQSQVYRMAGYFRDHKIPCDVLGLEPRWQTAAYSCSYVWNREFFPDPQQLIDSMQASHFHLNLWEHAFVAPVSPLRQALKSKAGDYLVWNGLVPDFADSSAANIFAAYHKTVFADKGISGFKLDECDNSNIATGGSTWSFPELSRFPSGIDGEQMHQQFGLLYQKTIYGIFKKSNKRTYLDVRASSDFASSYPAALYSDTYDHAAYIRMIGNAGFAGLLWSPEVRESHSTRELLRRTQTAILSAQTLFNSWYLQYPPWLQVDIDKNNKGILQDDANAAEASIKTLLDFRMSIVPYLYNAFAEYARKGEPPFRALVMDYPQDKNTWNISDEYLIGDCMLAAPLLADSDHRQVYLPAGAWFDYNSHQKFEGGKTYTFENGLTQIPVFIKEGSILPLAKPLGFIAPDTKFEITCYVYGDKPAHAQLFEDDGTTFDYEKGRYNVIDLYNDIPDSTISKTKKNAVSKNKTTFSKTRSTRTGNYKNEKYIISRWVHIQ